MADEDKGGIGRGVELLWGLAGPPTRGPKPGLSLREIVRAAIELVDREGLAALSMRRVAEQLGFTTMSLYRHVPGKDELIDVMYDTALGDPPAREPGGEWRAELARWARAAFAGHHRHTWLIEVAVRRPPVGPQGLRWFDAALSAVEGLGLPPHEMIAVVMVLEHYVRGAVQVAFGMAETARRDAEWEPAYWQLLQRVVTPADYPALARIVASGALAGAAEKIDDFEYGLQCVLDGVAARIERKAAR